MLFLIYWFDWYSFKKLWLMTFTYRWVSMFEFICIWLEFLSSGLVLEEKGFLMHYICRYTVEYRGIIVKCVWMFLLTIYIEYVKQWVCFNRGPWVNKRTELCIYKDIYATWNYHRLYCYMFFFRNYIRVKVLGLLF